MLSRMGRLVPRNSKCTTMHIRCCAGYNPPKTKPGARFGLAASRAQTEPSIVELAITYHCPQLAGQEMVRRPRPTDRHFTVFQLLGGSGVAILVFFYRLG